jgi:hypothetical protein
VPKLAPLKTTGDTTISFAVAEEKPAAKTTGSKAQPQKAEK